MSDSNAGQEAKKKPLNAAASAFVPKATAVPFVPGAGQRPPQPPMNPQMQQPGYYGDYSQRQLMYQQQMYGYMPPGAYGGHPGGRGGYGGQGAAYYPKPGHYQGQQQQGSDVPQQQNGSQGATPATDATAAPAADEKKSNSKDKVKENENNSKTDDNSKGATAVSTEPKAAVAKEEVVATSTATDKPAAAAAPVGSTAAAPAADVAKPAEPANMWRRDATAAAAPKASDASTAAAAADVTDWSRGKMMAEPIAEVIKRNDGRLRYDKRSMLALYVPYTGAIPDCLKSLYSMCSQAARTPQGIEAMNKEKDGRKHHHNNHHHNNSNNNSNSNNNNNNNSGSFGDDYVLTAEDVAEFKSALKSGFHYDPSRLNDDKNTAAVTINKANLTLNKLSVEKFDKLSDEFLTLGLHHDELMDKTVDMIVKKAQMQAPFAFMYAKLCRKMTDHWNDMPLPTDGSSASSAAAADADAADEDSSNKEPTYGKVFIRKLLERCEKEFDLDRTGMLLEITQNTELPEDDREEQEVKLKTRFEGHMKFVGELYHNDLITTKTVLAILREDFLPKTDEESLVCMVKLIETLGKKLEEQCYKKKKNYEAFQFIFDEISKLTEKKDIISVRVQCLLKGVIDLRDNRWVPRIQQLKAGKTSKSKTAPAATPTGWTTVATKPGKAVTTGKSPFGSSSKSLPAPFSGDARKAGNKFDALGGQSPSKKSGGKTATQDSYFSGRSSSNAPKASTSGGFNALSLDTNEEDDAEGDDAAGCSSPDVLQATSLPEDVVNRLKGRAHEYLKEVVSEAQTVEEIQEMLKTVATNAKNPNPLAYAVSIKYFLSMVMDGKDGDRDAICNMFAALVSRNVLSKEQFFEGLRIFLNDFDDLLLDTPHLLGYLAFILARCSAVHNLVDLTVLVDIPDENMFATSSYCGPLIAQTLRHVVALAAAGGSSSSSSSSAEETAASQAKGGLEVARELYRGSGVDFSKFVLAGRGETEASALADFLNKHQIAEVVKI